MKEQAQQELDLQARAEPSPLKKPYRKPEFLCERVFETMALSCGKIQSTQAQCRFNRSAS